MDIQKSKISVALLSVISNSILVILKLIVGISIGSVSVLSEAIHSGMDLLAAIIAFFAVKIAGKRADEEHPFGHAKVENISAAIEALLIVVAAAWIIFEAVRKIMAPQPMETVGWGIIVMLVSSVANLIVSQLLFTTGTKTDSAALMADGWHLRTDVYTSAGVMIGLGFIWVGGLILPQINLNWLDPIVAILVATLILRAAFSLTSHSVRDLIDTSTPESEKIWINGYLRGWYPTVRSFHRIRTRKAGATRFIDLHLVVDSIMTVNESHHISDEIVQGIKDKFPSADVILHIEPCDGVCTYNCSKGCLLSEEEQKSIRSSIKH